MRMNLALVVLVPEPLRSRMAEARARSGEKGAGNVEPHITIVPPISVALLDPVLAHLYDACRLQAPFEITLAGVGTFRPQSRVVFLRVAVGADELTRLEEAVQSGPLTRPASPRAPDRFPFHPHATIAMRVDDAALDIAAQALADADQSWTVSDVALLGKGVDRIWRTLHEIPLGRA
jgi:2'-5' RNA ligase